MLLPAARLSSARRAPCRAFPFQDRRPAPKRSIYLNLDPSQTEFTPCVSPEAARSAWKRLRGYAVTWLKRASAFPRRPDPCRLSPPPFSMTLESRSAAFIRIARWEKWRPRRRTMAPFRRVPLEQAREQPLVNGSVHRG